MLYQRLHGHTDVAPERVENAFSAEQLAVRIVDNVSVLYRDRAATRQQLVQLVGRVIRAAPGNYLVALPSFEYLEEFAEAFTREFPNVDTARQTRNMSEAAREAFLGAFDGASRRLGIVVLGGVFAESVDFSYAGLNGVICVGIGLPPANPVRDELAGYFAASENDAGFGEAVAYEQPAMSKVLQMAGRLLRGPGDRGVICLVDPRFRQPRYQRFFPAHWRPEIVSAETLASSLENFWRPDPALPRLPRVVQGTSD
jgi:CRISPR-associated exonuclease Cas4